jgi:translation initiation factor 3 subunit F
MSVYTSVKVHPVVFFQIVDTYERRPENAHRVIGTLLGSSVERGAVEVTNCFCVPHSETGEEVALELDFAKDLFDLHQKVNPNEVIVGWFATGPEIADLDVLIHEYYSRECTNPVHVTVDTTLVGDKMDMKAYVSVPMGVPGRTGGTMFAPVPLEVVSSDGERVGLEMCSRTKIAPNTMVEVAGDLDEVVKNVGGLKSLLQIVIRYVDGVCNGTVAAPDTTIGRRFLSLVNGVPKMTPAEFEEMLNNNVKDLLMVIYLAELTKTQLSVSEKLVNLTVGPPAAQ